MGTEIQKKNAAQVRTIRGMIESDSFKEQVARALPKHMTPDRFIRVAATAIMRVPKLAECDQASFAKAMLDLSSLGLEPDGRRAHLIPFMNNKRGCYEVQMIVDYKGLVELVMRSDDIAKIHADIVCDNDVFEYDMGRITAHKINYKKPRGAVMCAYAMAEFKNGAIKTEVMSIEEIESVRKRSKAGHSGPWVTDWNEMAKKTVFRRLSKWLPMSSEYHDALSADADSFDNVAKSVEFVSAPVNPNARKQADRVADPSKMIEEEAPEYIDVWGTQDEEEQEEQPQQRTLLEGLDKIADERQDVSGDEPPAFSATVQKLWDALEGDSNKLEKLTAFTDKEGKQVPGTRSFVTIKDKRAAIALRKWEESPEFGK